MSRIGLKSTAHCKPSRIGVSTRDGLTWQIQTLLKHKKLTKKRDLQEVFEVCHCVEVVYDQTAVRCFFSKDQKAGLLLDSCESCVFEVRLQLASPSLTCLFFVVTAGSRTHRGSISRRNGVSSLSFR